MIITENQIEYGFIPHPKYKHPTNEPVLANSVFNSRLVKVLQRMMEYNCDYLFFYADREHYMNFEYLTGFSPRFEEGILILSKTGKASILLGNECYGMFKTSRIPAEGFLFQVLSLPSQDCNGIDVLKDILVEIGLNRETKVGLVGWKLMYPDYADNHVFDIPSYMVDVLREIVGNQMIFNATDWFIHPDYGFRVINTTDEIAAFEYGASYASDAVDNIIRNMHSGMTEVEISTHSTCGFISQSCHPKVLLGDRTDLGMVSPTTNCAKLGDRCQIT